MSVGLPLAAGQSGPATSTGPTQDIALRPSLVANALNRAEAAAALAARMKFYALFSRLAAGLAAVLLVHGASAAEPSKWDGFVKDYIDGYFALNPSDAVNQGRHEFDGQLPDWSEAGLQKQIAWLQAQRV